MTKVNIIEDKMKEPTIHKAGNFYWNEDYGLCFLAQVDVALIKMISVREGNRFWGGVKVKDHASISEEEFKKICANFTPVSEVNISIKL